MKFKKLIRCFCPWISGLHSLLFRSISIKRSLSYVFQNVSLCVSQFFACFVKMEFDFLSLMILIKCLTSLKIWNLGHSWLQNFLFDFSYCSKKMGRYREGFWLNYTLQENKKSSHACVLKNQQTSFVYLFSTLLFIFVHSQENLPTFYFCSLSPSIPSIIAYSVCPIKNWQIMFQNHIDCLD